MKRLSLWELCERNRKGGLLYWVLRRTYKGRLSLYGPAGKPGGVTGLPWTLRDTERWLCKWSVSLYGNSVRGDMD